MKDANKDHFLSLSSAGGTECDKAVREITEALRRVNDAVAQAVNIGLSVEMVRISRCHDGCGNWGDQIAHAIQETHNIKAQSANMS